MLKIHVCILLNLCTYITFLECVENTGVCKRYSHNQLENICCDNFEPRSDDKDKCQECPPGSTSLRGLPCTVCQLNSYGSKCSFYCNCMKSEICDRVIGCITKYQTQRGVTTETGQDYFDGTTQENTGDETNDMNYIYIIITGMIAVAIGICVLFRKRTTAILFSLKKKRKSTPPCNNQLQAVYIENAQRDDSSYNIMDEKTLPGSTEDENDVYDYGW